MSAGIQKISTNSLEKQTNKQTKKRIKDLNRLLQIRKSKEPKSMQRCLASLIITEIQIKSHNEDFPGGTVVKNPPVNAGDTGSIPGPGRSHMPQSN